MATSQEKIKGGKVVSFKIKACLGRDNNDKQIFECKTWYPPVERTKAKSKKEAERVAIIWKAERKQSILLEQDTNNEALSVLIKQGYDVHESDGSFNALMLAVGSADEPMTAFLLANGADPHTWPDMDELPEEWRQNYYLEDIDIHYTDACYDHDEDYKAALVRTAQTFVKMSGLKKFGGLCLLLKEDGTVSLEPPKKKY